jgi:S-DNA-T family DNA segregation ATPase FtsK/SpoIIIE
MHVVLAAQNPTIQTVKVDLGNITARAAFRCAKRNFSETILGEKGAEDLKGQGDMYFLSPKNDGKQRVKGVYITHNELERMLDSIRGRPHSSSMFVRKLIILEIDLQEAEKFQGVNLPHRLSLTKREADDELLARVFMWALERDEISCNLLCNTFNIGWKRANSILEKLTELGVVGDMYAKLPRPVLPRKIEDIAAAIIDKMSLYGISTNDIATALNRNSLA